jgi:hypothetical protein
MRKQNLRLTFFMNVILICYYQLVLLAVCETEFYV